MKKGKRPTIVIIYNLTLIIVFFIIYYIIKDHFLNSEKKTPRIVDLFNLSITMQTSVGYSTFYPVTDLAKIVLIIQQLFLIFGNLIILHFMT